MNNEQPLMALMVIVTVAACKPDYVDPGPTNVTEAGFGDTGGGTGDTESINPSVCFADNAEAEAVRWQCEDFAEAVVRFTPSEEAVIPN